MPLFLLLHALLRSTSVAGRPFPPMAVSRAILALLASTMLMLAGCGGGENPSSNSTREQAAAKPATDAEAYRFLQQATFGPTPEQAARLGSIGYMAWIDEQFKAAPSSTHLATTNASANALQRSAAMADDITRSWWTHAVRDDASQLRHRVAFALSEIFVVSTVSLDKGAMVASYLDMLTARADGNYRDLLEAVALHPAMGTYLSHLANVKEDGKGRVPDENFAREVMQLFSIGLYELEDNGQLRLVNGKPVETYSATDIKGLARVFTGFSWYRPPGKEGLAWWVCYWRGPDCRDDSQFTLPMSSYPEAHATSVKQFLGVTIPAQSTPDPRASLKVALDTLANHHNTAPFIGRQLIQRLVTSNPSDAYVADVTQAWRQSNGNLRKVVEAILMHREARQPSTSISSSYGKLREPLLRATHLLRAIPHTSDQFNAGGDTPCYFAIDTSDPGTSLGQTPLRAPSVFNFFRPGYKPPQSLSANAGLVAPEMQIASETSALGYANFMATILSNGWGQWSSSRNRLDINFDLSGWTSQANNPAALVDAIATRMLGKTLPSAARDVAINGVSAMPAANDTQKRKRVQAAILLVAMSPDYLVQQ